MSAVGAPVAGSLERGSVLEVLEESRDNAGVLLEQLPGWLRPWCLHHLGGEPVEVLFAVDEVSTVLGLRLTGGDRVVVKACDRADRAVSCVAAQAQLAAKGFPCPRPLTGALLEGALDRPRLALLCPALPPSFGETPAGRPWCGTLGADRRVAALHGRSNSRTLRGEPSSLRRATSRVSPIADRYLELVRISAHGKARQTDKRGGPAGRS